MANNLPTLMVTVSGIIDEPNSTTVYKICKKAAEGNVLAEFRKEPLYGIADTLIVLRPINDLPSQITDKAHDGLVAAGFNVLIEPPIYGTLRKRPVLIDDPCVD